MLRFLHTKYLIWILIISILQASTSRCCLQQERHALLQLKAYFMSLLHSESSEDGEYLANYKLGSWGEEASNCCSWERVGCNGLMQHVTNLSLDYLLPYHEDPVSTYVLNVSLFQPFGELTSLDLSSNSIVGFVGHRGLCELQNLQELHLMDNSLSGNLPPSLGNLTSLRILDISYNSLSGELGSIIPNLKSLEYLDITENSFSGDFSLNSLLNHSNLGFFMLSNNRLLLKIDESLNLSNFQPQILGLSNCNLHMQSRSFLQFLSRLQNLQFLDISHNGLVGSFPTWLLHNNSVLEVMMLASNSFRGVLSLPKFVTQSLLLLDISDNHFSGIFPENIGTSIPSVRILNASTNSFEGRIPDSLGNLTNLKILELSNNNFSGELSIGMFKSCCRLEMLKLSNNNLEGDIIPRFLNITTQLGTLYLDRNHFNGTIEDRLLECVSYLNGLDISYNEVTGDIPSWIGNFSYLRILSMSDNQLKGQIPSELCNLHYILHLDLSNNGLTGVIPSCFNFSQLFGLQLQNNFLSGSIPNALSGSSRLLTFDLGDNQLSGGIPLWIGSLSQLKILLLGHNSLGGEIPKTLCQLQRLNIMDLSNNGISGGIPSCLGNMTFGTFPAPAYDVIHDELDASMILGVSTNWFHRAIDAPMSEEVVTIVTKSKYNDYYGSIRLIMSMLDLSCNRLTGRIPKELGEFDKLRGLNLSHNELFGSIPSSFSMLKSVESLDLSCNNLTGAIPSQLAHVTALEIFNVSYNNLSGMVLETGQFASFDESNYRGNPFLCGYVGKSCKTTSKDASPDQDDDGSTPGFDWEIFLWSLVCPLSLYF